jgi:choline dehydrogenase-like flavoprotein
MAATDPVDILIVGSGASGGPFAWALSQVPGIRIMCLEQGDWDREDTLRETQEQWQRLVKPLPKQPGANYFTNGYPYDHTESYWEPVLGFAVGGGMVHYSAGWGPFRRSDFLLRSLTGVGDDWPITYDDLVPFYDQNDRMVGVSGVPGNPVYAGRDVDFQPLRGFTWGSNKLRQACDTLGWFWWPGEQAIITAPFRGRDPKNFRERKNRSDVVHWPEAIRNGVVLKTRSTVREITVDKRGLADGALYFDAQGQLHRQKARIVVVACNGIGTPRLLLNSKSALFPAGLANHTGLVGAGLMGHPKILTTAVFEDEDPSAGAGGGIKIHEFYDPKPGRSFVGGFQMSGGSFSSPTAVALGTPPESMVTAIPASLEHGLTPTGRRLPWGNAHHAAFAERFRRTASVQAHSSELRVESNRVELHATLTDDFGTPAPKLVYERSENTKAILAFAIERSKELMQAAGATSVESGWDTSTAGRGASPGHYFGTARMGTNPRTSVVDKWGRSHEVRNLFVIDGSTFVTSGATEPTSTIQANALRIADYVKKNARQLLSGARS